jgi:hypothetical protein
MKKDISKPAAQGNLRKIAASIPPGRFPQRSEIVSGNESKEMTPIAAAQSKKTKKKIAISAIAKPAAKTSTR